MVDILERLRSPQTSLGTLWPQPNLHEEAADEITRLREENAAERLVAKDNLDWFNALKTDYDALREENARLLGENWELVMRAHALLSLLPPETTCGQVQEARAKLAAIREGGKDEN